MITNRIIPKCAPVEYGRGACASRKGAEVYDRQKLHLYIRFMIQNQTADLVPAEFREAIFTGGYVERIPHKPYDVLTLTPKGRDYLRKFAPEESEA